MIPVKRISHATLETPDLDRQIDYYINIVGLTLLAKDSSQAIFASRLGQLALVLNRGAAARLARLVFQVAQHADLAAIAKALAAEGIAAEVRHDTLPGLSKVLSFVDPKGTMIDVFAEVRPSTASQPGGVAPYKLGHVSYQLPDIHPLIAFYQKILGFRISDWQEDFFVFMRCGRDHHTINFATGKSSRMHHMAFELRDWSHVINACDHLGLNKIPIIWGPGRHGISHNIFTYHRNPDDLMVEFYAEMDQMTDEELGYFEPRPYHKDNPQRPKVWDRKSAALMWGPPQGPDHARQRME
jgi:catechol-2,3-dioxygenase